MDLHACNCTHYTPSARIKVSLLLYRNSRAILQIGLVLVSSPCLTCCCQIMFPTSTNCVADASPTRFCPLNGANRPVSHLFCWWTGRGRRSIKIEMQWQANHDGRGWIRTARGRMDRDKRGRIITTGDSQGREGGWTAPGGAVTIPFSREVTH